MQISIHYKEENQPKPNQLIVPSVHGVNVNEDKKILFQKREDSPKWAIPGGKVDLGETPEQSLAREMKEELNVDVEVKKFLGIYSSPDYVLSVGEAVFQPFLLAYECKILSGVPQKTAESVDYLWAGPEDITLKKFFPLSRELVETALGLRDVPLTNVTV